MENKTKIIPFGFLIFLSLFGCNHSPNNCEIEKSLFSFKHDSLNNLILDIKKYSKPHSLTYVQINGKQYKIEKIVDCNSFESIFEGKDSTSLNNDYYKLNPIFSYFKDKKYLYFYYEDSSYLIVKGKSDQYECLGGPYLKIKNTIYYDGKEVIGADNTSFRTITVYRNKSEWMKTVGLDENNIFNGENKMTEDMFNRLLWENKDSIKRAYFNY
jgi:hypothetical protein